MRNKNLQAWMIVLTLIATTLSRGTAPAASVGPSGYTNDFSTQPAAADWSSYGIPGANTLINNTTANTATINEDTIRMPLGPAIEDPVGQFHSIDTIEDFAINCSGIAPFPWEDY